MIARACAIHRVERVVVYRDEDTDFFRKHASLIEKVLKYLNTPPYLRKRIIPIDKDLKYVGMLKPLALPIHPKKDDAVINTVRVGLIEQINDSITKAFIGLRKRCVIKGAHEIAPGALVLLKVLEEKNDHYVCALLDQPDVYTGFTVASYDNVVDALRNECRDLILIEFTKHGEDPLKLRSFLKEKTAIGLTGICALFGSPDKDFNEIIKYVYRTSLEAIVEPHNLVRVNAVPYQGVRSIRTIEALYIALTLLNSVLYELGVCT